jgi:hypothetical protein
MPDDLSHIGEDFEAWLESATTASADDTLLAPVRSAMPLEINGCVVSTQGQLYSIESKGRLGGEYWTGFASEGDHAAVMTTWKKGKLGERDTGALPPTRHTSVLKRLGFRTVGREGGRRHPLL